jgi:hypothetical protein
MTEHRNVHELVARAEITVAGIEGPEAKEAALRRVLASMLAGEGPGAAAGSPVPRWSREDLDKLALEHTVLMCVFASSMLLNVVHELVPAWRGSAMTLSGFAMWIALSMLLYSISKRLYGVTVSTALALLALVPVVGCVVLLAVDRKAMNILMQNGFVVGLVRARPRAIALEG